ncbi:hypothetical protein CRUP_008185, partial [Coryphaenoides rupestris]
VDPSLQADHRIQVSVQAALPGSKHLKSRAANARDERFRSGKTRNDLHTEAVQAALAKYKERKMPMPSKRRSVLVQSSVEACTPPGVQGGAGGLLLHLRALLRRAALQRAPRPLRPRARPLPARRHLPAARGRRRLLQMSSW